MLGAGRIARKPRFRGCALLVAASAAACGDGSTDPPLTRPPMVIGTVADFELVVGDTATLEASGYFRDPDGDVLSFEVRSSAAEVAGAEVSGSTVRVVALAQGTSTVAITARDPEGRAAALRFEVTVPNRFDIDVRFDTTATEPWRAVVLAAAELWMSVLADTDLPEVAVDDRIECYGANTAEPVGTIDDLMILVEFRDIDGPGRTLAQAGVCRLREGSMLPVASVAFFDVSDFDGLIDSGDATELAVHEIAHALGFGLLWRPLDLLRDPALGVGAIDAHFVGPEAIAAFDAAGGTDYTGGAKVPVENFGGVGSANLHWRGSVLRGELMRPLNRIGSRETLSAITIRSLADLGYRVDASLAEPYTLPGVGAADEKPGRAVDLGDDVLRGPVQVVDAEGRVVRVLRDRSPR
ncbi:leishmanolysin-related zinc metalloendopeptidase [Candidatus Palauibacter irciniicola]|uniref:leishmanolysin-related zinc metalloendopeptidase n=1 Tax=Candidatus Palauibacter irciniicola TaxID=3056733 RepID=UPI003B028F7A